MNGLLERFATVEFADAVVGVYRDPDRTAEVHAGRVHYGWIGQFSYEPISEIAVTDLVWWRNPDDPIMFSELVGDDPVDVYNAAIDSGWNIAMWGLAL